MSTISASTATNTAYKVTADTTGTLVLQTGATPTTAVTIDGSQNVGIGTSSPAYKLDAVATDGIFKFSKSGGASGYLLLGGTSVNLSYDTSGNYAWSVTSNDVGAYTAGVKRMAIDASGNLLVGTTSSGLTNSNGIVLNPSGNSSLFQHVSGTASGTGYFVFGYNAGIVGSITQNGTTGVLYNLTSDYRLKNDQQPLTGAKEFVMALQPKKWQWWDGSGEGVGFIAHEFMEVAKYSGHGEKDAVDDEGNIIPQSIQPSSSEVMANLVAFIQELKAELDAAKADIATLKGTA
jgi:hypothetical protein